MSEHRDKPVAWERRPDGKIGPTEMTRPTAQWVGLTDDEIWDICPAIINLEYAKTIEAKLKEKNNG